MSSDYSNGPFIFSLIAFFSGFYGLGSLVAARKNLKLQHALEKSSTRGISSIHTELLSRCQDYLASEGSEAAALPTGSLAIPAKITGFTSCAANQHPLISSSGDRAVLLRKQVKEVKEVFHESTRIFTRNGEEMREITLKREIVENFIAEEQSENRFLWILEEERKDGAAGGGNGENVIPGVYPDVYFPQMIRFEPSWVNGNNEIWRKVKEDFIPAPNVQPSLSVEIQVVLGNSYGGSGRCREPQVIGRKSIESIIPEGERISALGTVKYDPTTKEMTMTDEGENSMLCYGSPLEARERSSRLAASWRRHALYSGALTAVALALAFGSSKFQASGK